MRCNALFPLKGPIFRILNRLIFDAKFGFWDPPASGPDGTSSSTAVGALRTAGDRNAETGAADGVHVSRLRIRVQLPAPDVNRQTPQRTSHSDKRDTTHSTSTSTPTSPHVSRLGPDEVYVPAHKRSRSARLPRRPGCGENGERPPPLAVYVRRVNAPVVPPSIANSTERPEPLASAAAERRRA